MKTRFLIPLLLPLVWLIHLSGCSNPCKYSDCQNGGVCIEGVCQCPPGFGGDNCNQITSTLSAKVNGSRWDAFRIEFHPPDNTQFFPTISATNEGEDRSLQFALTTGTAQGSYPLHDSLIPNKPAFISWNVDTTAYNAADGELVITRDEPDRIEGIFYFTAVQIYTDDTIQITDGIFSIEK